MGQEQSSLLDEGTPPETLTERSLPAVAKFIKDGHARRIVVMTGAGLSTAAGIPDFRSPNTGLYANLARLNLPYAEAVFDISYFRENPDPFYVLARELYPGNYSPTISHVFIALLAKKGLLKMLFTQNIDCLERQAGVPGELIVEAHGSFAEQRCIECKTPFPDDTMKEHVFKGEVPRCLDKKCGGLVKPDIVFFGEQLPEAFHRNREVPSTADLVLILGTSLTVQPFASLPEYTRDGTPRILFNLERVGSLGSRPDDVLVLGDCDSGLRRLADELGWRDELEAKWRAVVGEEEAERQLQNAKKLEAELQGEVEELADRVGEGLKLDDEPGGRDDTDTEGEDDALGKVEDSQAVDPAFDSEDKLDQGDNTPSTSATEEVKEDKLPQAKSDLLLTEDKEKVIATEAAVHDEPSGPTQEADAKPKEDTVKDQETASEQTSTQSHETAGKPTL
ncbi:NAD-dependent protein deacetylase hst2-1 [Cytospora mali]|uniref:NAD-dependent protein deacetylase hst2-1 n=1 Tax=Cytospora mali TaxID=578113 RepID=A0A194UWQ7_CYTMA|nr:NAD-dependent protein deacetylase hst2-1 [Valsa mali var. pyri (nom. inval.)]